MNQSNKKIPSIKIFVAVIIISFLGLADASYLAAKYYSGAIPPCLISGCEAVTTSKYASIGGISVALMGAIYYLIILGASIAYFDLRKKWMISFLSKFSIIGLSASLWFIFVQAFLLKAFCLYCIFSAITSISIFALFFLAKKNNPQPALQENPKGI